MSWWRHEDRGWGLVVTHKHTLNTFLQPQAENCLGWLCVHYKATFMFFMWCLFTAEPMRVSFMYFLYTVGMSCNLGRQHPMGTWLSHHFPHRPSLVQPLSPAGGSSQGPGGGAPCLNGAGPGRPLCPRTPFVFPPLEALPSQPTAACAARGQPGVLHGHSTTAPPDLKSSGKRHRDVL